MNMTSTFIHLFIRAFETHRLICSITDSATSISLYQDVNPEQQQYLLQIKSIQVLFLINQFDLLILLYDMSYSCCDELRI